MIPFAIHLTTTVIKHEMAFIVMETPGKNTHRPCVYGQHYSPVRPHEKVSWPHQYMAGLAPPPNDRQNQTLKQKYILWFSELHYHT